MAQKIQDKLGETFVVRGQGRAVTIESKDGNPWRVAGPLRGGKPTRGQKLALVTELLGQPETAAWSNRKIARLCFCSHPFVAIVRAQVAAAIAPPVVRPAEARQPDEAARSLPIVARPAASCPGGWPSARWVRYSAADEPGRVRTDFDPFG